MKMLNFIWLELRQFIGTEKFLFVTLFMPTLLVFIIFVPPYLFYESPPNQKIIGVIDQDSAKVYEVFEKKINNLVIQKSEVTNYIIQHIELKSTPEIDSVQIIVDSLQFRVDSIFAAYDKINRYREKIFLQKRLNRKKKQGILTSTFEKLQQLKAALEEETRKFLAEKERLDDLQEIQLKKQADKKLLDNSIDLYIVFSQESIDKGVVELHTLKAGEFLRIDLIRKALEQSLLEVRTASAHLPEDLAQDLLQPLTVREYWLTQEKKESFNILTGYIIPVFLAILIAISLVMMSESFYLETLKDKFHNRFELMFYKYSAWQWLILRLTAFILSGFIQVFIWSAMLYLAIKLNIFDVEMLRDLSLNNYFIIILSYLLALVSLSLIHLLFMPFVSARNERYTFSIQIMRLIIFVPVIFAFLFIRSVNPHNTLLLGMFPFYTPIFYALFINNHPFYYSQFITNGIIIGSQALFVSLFFWKIRQLSLFWYKATIPFSVFLKKMFKR